MTHDRPVNGLSALDEALCEHYQRQQLRPETVDRLLAGVGNHAPGRLQRTSHRRRAVAALVALVGIVLALATFHLIGNLEGSRAAERVRQEVATNHLKLLRPEVRSGDLEALRRTMSELDFHLIEPSDGTLARYRLVGARYCSIQGQLAAQLQLVDTEGRPLTLYQTGLSPELEAIPPGAAAVRGIPVRLWRESGVFLASAGPTADSLRPRPPAGH